MAILKQSKHSSCGADVHARSDGGNTPLHLAVAQGQTETAVALVSAGADIHARDDGDVTPLHLAAMQGHTGTAQILTGEEVYVTSVPVGPEAQPNFKQKEDCGQTSEYGFDCVQRQGTEFLAYHEDIDQPLTVHIKPRIGIHRKYVGKDVYVCFPVHERWYLMPHKLVEVRERDGWIRGRGMSGIYHNANPSRYLLEGISEFVVKARTNQRGCSQRFRRRALTYPWDLVDDGVDAALDRIVDLTGARRSSSRPAITSRTTSSRITRSPRYASARTARSSSPRSYRATRPLRSSPMSAGA